MPRAASAEPALSVGVVSALAQVFPESRLATAPAAQLEAARYEWEPFQIVVRAGAAPLDGVRAQAGPLVGPGAARLDPPRLYRVEYLDVHTASSIEGRPGRWPDPLVPDVDAFVSEKRRAFPFHVPAGESRAIWVELFVPDGSRAGRYRGQVTVEMNGHGPLAIPVELTVHDFTLPKSSSMPVTFGFSRGAVARAHGPLGAAFTESLQRRYEVSALRHRISLHGGSMEPAPYSLDGARVRIDFRPYDAEVGPLLDGTADEDGPAQGARFSAIDLRVPVRLEGAPRTDYLRQLVAHLRARGWLDRLFDYTWDEPADAELPKVRARAEALRAAVPEVPRLVTRELDARLAGAVDIWCPVVNRVDDKPENPKAKPPAAYPGRLWWYQSCMSHGCDIVGGRYFTGWPSYAVDAPAIAHRVFEWLTFRYHVGGELYYNTVEAYGRVADPWRDLRLHGGNGDGTLFYPGRPERIGGQTPIPVESIRLKLIREGLEDYEYLTLYAARAGRARADEAAAEIAQRTFRFEHDPERLYGVRRRIAAFLDGAPR